MESLDFQLVYFTTKFFQTLQKKSSTYCYSDNKPFRNTLNMRTWRAHAPIFFFLFFTFYYYYFLFSFPFYKPLKKNEMALFLQSAQFHSILSLYFVLRLARLAARALAPIDHQTYFKFSMSLNKLKYIPRIYENSNQQF